jgi:hypothetical protein
VTLTEFEDGLRLEGYEVLVIRDGAEAGLQARSSGQTPGATPRPTKRLAFQEVRLPDLPPAKRHVETPACHN